MMPRLKEVLDGNLTDSLVYTQFDKLFRRWGESKRDREGLHASSVIASEKDFCYREHVLAAFFEKSKTFLSIGLLKIFRHGVAVHEKWQQMFKEAGIARSIEVTRKSNALNVYFTPDAIIELLGRLWIVEIKSMNTFQFKRLQSPPANAVRQSNFYMHMAAIPRALVLVEDKNDQDYKVWGIKYDPDIARPFVERAMNINRLISAFDQHGKLPRRICKSSDSKRAQNCPMREACFAGRKKRERMRKA